MFHVWTLLPAIYVCLRFIMPMRVHIAVKILLGFVIVGGCEFHLVSRLAFGSMFSPELPQPLMIILGWLFGSTLFLSLMLLGLDVYNILRHVILQRWYGRSTDKNRDVSRCRPACRLWCV